MHSSHRSHLYCSPRRHGGGGPSFGVRRPLRYLAHKLDLDDEQTSELARILRDLKTERAQSEVDDNRAVTRLANAVAGEAYDEASAKEALDLRVESTRRVQEQVIAAFREIHGLLDEEQRGRLATMIRTGVVLL